MTDTSDHFVYWLLDADDECIYVGCTDNPERRWREHYRRLGEEIATRRAAGPFTRRDALAKELSEIKSLTPKYNGRLKTLPNQFQSWSADVSSPDQEVLDRAADLLVVKYLARRRAS